MRSHETHESCQISRTHMDLLKAFSFCAWNKIKKYHTNSPIKHNTCWLQTLLKSANSISAALLTHTHTHTHTPACAEQLLSHWTALISLYSCVDLNIRSCLWGNMNIWNMLRFVVYKHTLIHSHTHTHTHILNLITWLDLLGCDWSLHHWPVKYLCMLRLNCSFIITGIIHPMLIVSLLLIKSEQLTAILQMPQKSLGV